MVRKEILDILIKKHIVTEQDVKNAESSGGDIIRTLLLQKRLNSSIIADAVAEHYKLERARDLVNIKPFLGLPIQLLSKYNIFPVKVENNKLYAAMSDPLNISATDAVRIATGYEVIPMVATEEEIKAAIHKWYEREPEIEIDESAEIDEPAEDAPDSPAVKIVQNIIESAIIERASDIHIEAGRSKITVRFRVDGTLRKYAEYPKSAHHPVLSRIKVMAGLDITERRLPQDGKIRISKPRSVDLRVSTLPTTYGEKAVIRILDRTNVLPNIESLGYSDEALKKLRQAIKAPYGMILLTGPTGSGKTTTLYAALSEIISEDINVVTVEDPPEYEMPGVNQVPVASDIGLTFATALRSILRQDPDIIMVGEIRDEETAKVAVHAALTGHLVFSTLHTNDAVSAPIRLIDMGVEPYLVASSLIAVAAQRLVRTVCENCAETYTPMPASEEYSFLGLEPEKTVFLRRGTGCPLCGNTGYKGRTVIAEVLVVTKAIRELIKNRAPADDIKAQAIKDGMATLLDDARKKVLKGATTANEAAKSVFMPE